MQKIKKNRQIFHTGNPGGQDTLSHNAVNNQPVNCFLIHCLSKISPALYGYFQKQAFKNTVARVLFFWYFLILTVHILKIR